MEALRRFQAGWKYPTALLCIYGFFSTVKPLEPFLIPFLMGPDKNLTTEQVNNQIFPVWTYSYLAVLLPVFLLTDYLRYKPVLVIQGISLWATTAMLLWARGVAAMQAMQFLYGVATACEVAYFSYIYSAVEPQYYRKVTACCRAVQLLGYMSGSVLGQLLVSFKLLSYHNMLVFTIILISTSLAASCCLPLPHRSAFFHRQSGRGDAAVEAPTDIGRNADDGSGGTPPGENLAAGRTGILVLLWRDVLQCYSRRQLSWSVWWALATCGYYQTTNYVQVLWEYVEPSQNFTVYNGGVEAISNLFGAVTASSVGVTKVDWTLWGELTMGFSSGLGAAALFLAVFTQNIWVCYCSYIVFKSLYMLVITIAMFQIAAQLSIERYALVFGANTFAALILQTIITVVVVDSGGLGLDILSQFMVYGSYFSTIALLFLVRGVYILALACQACGQRTTD